MLALVLMAALLACGLPAALQTPAPEATVAGIVPATAAPTLAPAGAPTGETTPAPAVGAVPTQATAALGSEGAEVATPLPGAESDEELKRLLLELINADRAGAGLEPVAPDEAAGRAAQVHAEEMARAGYMSHWNLAGHGPPYRYSQAGGLAAAAENVYMYWQRYDDGSPAPIDDWPQVIREAQASLMDSPGHRANILAPERTHVGLGLAYNAATGDVRLDQLFVNHYLDLEPLPLRAGLGQAISLRGRLLTGASAPLLNLAYEPFPAPLSVAELNQTGTYRSTAEIYDAATLLPDGQGGFEKQVVLDHEGRPGLYHVRLWVQTQHGEVPAVEVVIEVR